MAIQCEICDSTNLIKQNNVFVCQDCGAQYTVEAVRKMVSNPSKSAPAPAPEPAPAEAEPPKKTDVSEFLLKADQAHKEGNDGAARTFLEHATWIAPYDPEVLRRRICYGTRLTWGPMKEMVLQAPAQKKNEVKELAYQLMEEQARTRIDKSGYSFERRDSDNLISSELPRVEIENVWDKERWLTIYFIGIAQQCLAFELPKNTSASGLYAPAHYRLLHMVNNADSYFETADSLIPDECREELFTAFCKMAKKICNARFYVEGDPAWRSEPLTESHWLYGNDLKNARKVLKKYEDVCQTLAAKRAEKEEADRLAKEKAYWDAHPEERKAKLTAECQKLIEECETAKRDLADMQNKLQEAKENLARLTREYDSLGLFQGKRKKQITEEKLAIYDARSDLDNKIPLKEQEIRALNSQINTLNQEIAKIQ